MQNTDVAISGGGMVGLALACGLQGSGLRVTVLDPHPLQPVSMDDPPELRVSAINAASETWLRYLGVWQSITSLRASRYHQIEVWDKDSFGQIHFSDQQFGYQQLGYIIENAVIRQALWQRVQQCSDIRLLAGVQIQRLVMGENDAVLTLDNGNTLAARLLVAADGASSWLRQQADIPLTFWDYRHHALVATIHCQLPHQACARQVFHGDGILAFLPLSDPHLCSIVWSLPPGKAQQMQALSVEQFSQILTITFDNRVGQCQLASERLVIPLTARYARQFAAHRLALIGDAAHTIHPLAGQGVNLGFMDAAELTGELCRLQREGKDIGQHLWLKRYERRRKYDTIRMLACMQGLCELFAGEHPAKKLLRDLGLTFADKLPLLKPYLIHQATGLPDLPQWLRQYTDS